MLSTSAIPFQSLLVAFRPRDHRCDPADLRHTEAIAPSVSGSRCQAAARKGSRRRCVAIAPANGQRLVTLLHRAEA